MDIMQLRKLRMSPNALLNDFIGSITFIEIGTVKTVYGEGERIDVLLPYKQPDKQDDIVRNVELLQYGNALAKVTIPPQEGDVVLIFNPKNSIVKAKAKPTLTQLACSYYSPIGYKAILLQGLLAEEAKATIQFAKNGALTINCKDKVTINGHLEIAGAN